MDQFSWRAFAVGAVGLVLSGAAPAQPIAVVSLDLGRPAASFRPDEALGAAFDGGGAGQIDAQLTPRNIAAMRGAGLRPLTYRLRTELAIEAWHWTDKGRWSDPAHTQGYWTGDAKAAATPPVTYGYALPRRGDTVDQANNVGYSRLTDGDRASFWKSNPYLDARYTGEITPRPQWAVLDLGARRSIGAARIAWATPYAVRYRVEHWTGADEYDPDGRWVAFDGGVVENSRGGEATLAFKPAQTRFVRVLMLASSGTAPAGSTDARDGLGFAIAELSFGSVDAGGFHDLVRHGKAAASQTFAQVSSTDPWHRAIDRDPDIEQPGLDRMFESGLTNGLPMMVPVGALYDTPENAAAEIAYLKRRGRPVRQVELGEEPDGQYADAEHYGALYLEFAEALRKVDPTLVFGGPSSQSGTVDTWLDSDPDHSWTRRFIRYLRARGRLADLGFFSFERYPFDDLCGSIEEKLRDQTGMMADTLKRLADDEVPATTPLVISEYGFSAYSGRAESELPSALLNADMVGQFLTAGGAAAYLFGYPPNDPANQHLACAGWGNMMLQQADANGRAGANMPAYWAARMMSQDWTLAGHGLHQLYRANADLADAKGRSLVTAYAVRRPDGALAVMLVNRDARRAHPVRIAPTLRGPLAVVQYSQAQYAWLDVGPKSHPVRDLPPVRSQMKNGASVVTLPPFSLTVVRELRS